MSKYDKETKFYWLQLKEDFFEDDAINWLEEQLPNGRDYAYFYLKLCLKSLKSNGVLIRKVGNIIIPYDNKKLAELTKMDFDTVTVAMELLKQIGLVEILENGEIYISQLETLIGSKSVGALKKQQQRLMGGQMSAECPPKIELKQEIENRDIIKDKVIIQNNNNIYKTIENNFARPLVPFEYEKIQYWLSSLSFEKNEIEKIIIHAINIAVMSGKRTFNYVNGILNNWLGNNYKTLNDILESEKIIQKNVDNKNDINLNETLFEYNWLDEEGNDLN